MVLQIANKKYDKAFKQQVSKLHLDQGRTIASLSKEYSISKSTLTVRLRSLVKNLLNLKLRLPPMYITTT